MSDYSARTNNGLSFSGSDVGIFQATVLASALKLYAKTGMKVNASYTPTNMLRTAGQITGKHYKRGQFEEAEKDLRALADALKAQPRVEA